MRSFLLRVGIGGLVAAAVLALAGYFAADVAQAVFSTDRDAGTDVAETLKVRLPVGMAVWGFILVFLFEALKSLWKKPPVKAPEPNPTEEAEKLLLQLIEQAEAAENARASVTDLSQTPAPKALDPVATSVST